MERVARCICLSGDEGHSCYESSNCGDAVDFHCIATDVERKLSDDFAGGN